MKRFTLSYVRVIMNQQNTRSLATPAKFDSWLQQFPAGRPGTYYTQQHREASSHAHAEAWTPYDGVPSHNDAPPSGGRFRDNRTDKPWRSGGDADRHHQVSDRRVFPSHNNRDQRDIRGGDAHSPVSKRSRVPGPERQRNNRASRREQQFPGRPSHSHSQGVNSVRHDAAWLAENFPNGISPETYKGAPSTLFENPKVFLWDSKGINARSAFIAERGGSFRCNVFLSFPDQSVPKLDAIGDGITKKEAEKNACQHAIFKLHEAGLLKDVAIPSQINEFNTALIKEEADAKMDIYDYCARFDTIPYFDVREVRLRGRNTVEVEVRMEQQGICAIARAKERRSAEILACIEFKHQAEEWHAKNGEENLIVKDASSLNSRNAKKFFEFYKMKNRSAEYDVRLQHAKGSKRLTGSTTSGQMTLNGEPIGEPVEMQGKRLADIAAYLTGAIALKQKYPDLFVEFVEALRQGNGELLKPVQPTWLNIDQDCLLSMTDTILQCRKSGMGVSEAPEEVDEAIRRPPPRRLLPFNQLESKSAQLKEEFDAYMTNAKIEELRRKKSELPMNQYRDQVLKLVASSPVSIIVGATGSGKTTQVPQIIFDQAIQAGKGASCNIICTQPRRIAATSVAQRVAVERNEQLQKTVGYHVRFDAKLPQPGGSINYCTTGILLQQLRNHPEEALSGITHIIIDEVHERDILIDLLLVILKRVMANRKRTRLPEIKVILMSATMDTELFAGYFKQRNAEGKSIPCPSLSVPGRTFPVKELFLEDIEAQLRNAYPPGDVNRLLNEKDTREYLEVETRFVPQVKEGSVSSDMVDGEDDAEAVINWKAETTFTADGAVSAQTEKEDALIPTGLIAATIGHIAHTTDEGAILVFLPGLQEITSVDEMLRSQKPLGIDFTDQSKWKVSMLHSSIPTVQNEIFGDVGAGCRKIILSTNIAETSVTIPDVQYVVDAGKMREKQYEQARRITRLACTWISKSNSKQRAGRAGRVQNGNYFALFSKKRFNSLRAAGLPEMLRSDLQEICLDIKAQGFTDPVAQFLSEAIEPPSPAAIEASLQQLRMLTALDESEQLTPLGKVLATLPVEPALGKMILLGVIFRCLDPMLILGALSSAREIFVSPLQLRRESERCKIAFMRGTNSDHIASLNAFREWREIRDRQGQFAAHRFAEENFLHRGALKTIDQTASQIEDLLVESRLIPKTRPSDRFRSELGHPSLNDNASSVPLIKALTLSGMYPNLAISTGGRGLRTANENFTMIHPNSANYPRRNEDNFPFGTPVTFSTKAKSNDGTSILLRSTTEVTTLATVLFGGKLRTFSNTIEIDGWIPLLANVSTLKVTWEFRKCLDRLLHVAFQDLSRSGNNRSNFLADHPARETFARGLVEVLDRDVKRRERIERIDRGPENRSMGTARPGGGGNVTWRK
ncbi:P-loop containing nucleoside triphosphate hydrolase protein [Peziza echinospora]|nr:P-loop containing nucleoside triphosphate hydrolase protein [Peziza echinospora]